MGASRDDIINAAQLLANHVLLSSVFRIYEIESAYELLSDDLIKAAIRICKVPKPIQLPKGGLEHCFHSFFGRLDQNHGIYPGHKLGFNAHEPQITKGIASFLDPVTHGKQGEIRLKAFLRALLEGRSEKDALVTSLESEKPFSFTIKAEKEVKIEKSKSRFIDLFIGWNPLNPNHDPVKYKYGVLIEAKIKSEVSNDQLPSYAEHATEVFENKALYLLTLNGESRHENWQPVGWLILMSRWERRLNDVDADFTQFRRFIWKELGS